MGTRLLIVAIGILAGCASPLSAYDPAAKEAPARIIAKRIVDRINRPTADGSVMFLPVAGVLVPIQTSRGGPSQIAIYEYAVETNEKATVRVLSEYFAFEVGQCVTLFTSDQPTYPRISQGSGCK
jgi:hypothetical protein